MLEIPKCSVMSLKHQNYLNIKLNINNDVMMYHKILFNSDHFSHIKTLYTPLLLNCHHF